MDSDCKTMPEGLVPAQRVVLFYNGTPRTTCTWDGYDSVKTVPTEKAYTVVFNEDDMRLCAEIVRKVIDEYIEEIVAAFAKIGEAMAEAFNVGFKGLTEACETLQAAFQEIENVNSTRIGVSPKKRRMSVRNCPRQMASNYNYIPRAPRNLPYMRRAY